MTQHVLSQKQISWAYEKYCEGYTLEQISDALYVCGMTLRRAFKRNGLTRVRPVLVAPDDIRGDQDAD